MQLRCNRFDDRPIIELSESFWALFTVGKFEKWEIWAKLPILGTSTIFMLVIIIG